MNFFEAQAKAKRASFSLLLLFLLALLALIALTVLFVFVLLFYENFSQLPQNFEELFSFLERKEAQSLILFSALAVMVVVGFGSLLRYIRLRKGGEAIALMLGAQKLSAQTQDKKEQMLFHVVEEMAIASGVAMPELFLIQEEAINAFTAGFNQNNTVIAVTKGTLTHLNRQELQGVIAHEFSHIFHGDVRLNMKMSALLQGIVMIGNSGRFILRLLLDGSPRAHYHKRDRDKNGGQIVVILFVLGLGLMIIGFVGSLFGMLIKARINQKREYLADASAVQYTRYPKGLAAALKKIGALEAQSYLKIPNANDFAHFFFADAMQSFWDKIASTHPPLIKRIKALDPYFSGTFRPYKTPHKPKQRQKQNPKKESKKASKEQIAKNLLYGIGVLNEQALTSAHTKLQSIEPKLLALTKEPLSAQALFLFILTHKEPALLKKQWSQAQEQNRELFFALLELQKLRITPKEDELFTLIQLAIPTLKMLSKPQYLRFKALLETFIQADNHITLFEFALFSLLIEPLDEHFELLKKRAIRHSHLGAIKDEAQIFLSFFCYEQYQDDTKAQKAFEQIKKTHKVTALRYQKRHEYQNETLFESIQTLSHAGLMLKKRLLEMALLAIKDDGHISSQEYLLIEALAKILQLPLSIDWYQ